MSNQEAKWRKLEQESCSFLKSVFRDNNISFKCEGDSNSGEVDIKVIKNGKIINSLEVKSDKCQAGQFVVLLDNSNFVFSEKSKTQQTVNTLHILDYLNNNFDKYKEVKAKGIPIDIDKSIIYNRIIEYYKIEKKCDYFITRNSLNNEFVIFNCEKLNEYFDVNCVLRRKKSGSSFMPKKYINEVISYIQTYFSFKNINIERIYNDNNKYYIEFKDKLSKTDVSLNVNNIDIYLSKENNIESSEGLVTYSIRKLSSTNNPNVMFVMNLKKDIPNKDFIEELTIKFLS